MTENVLWERKVVMPTLVDVGIEEKEDVFARSISKVALQEETVGLVDVHGMRQVISGLNIGVPLQIVVAVRQGQHYVGLAHTSQQDARILGRNQHSFVIEN